MSILLPAVIAVILGSWYWRRRGKASIACIPGPESPSFILGNFAEFYQYGVGEHEFRWQEEFGPVYRVKSLLGEDRLVIADPKALQHIYQTANTLWLKPTVRREFSRMFLGRGIAWAQGDDHKRHRKVLTPAFGNIESRGMMPIFRKVADRMCQHWKSVITDGHSDSNEIEYLNGCLVPLSTLLAKLHSITNSAAWKTPTTLLLEAIRICLLKPLACRIVAKFSSNTCSYTSRCLSSTLFSDFQPSNDCERSRRKAIELQETSSTKKLKRCRTIGRLTGTSWIFSSQLTRLKMRRTSCRRILAEMRTIIAAGHETTGSSLCFILYELARHPEVQEKVRTEIRSAFEAVHARGDSDYTITDLEGMHYVLAVLKEVLRIHPVVYGPFVVAAMDDAIPLSTPIRTTDGRTITSIPVSAGRYVHSLIAGYNRLKDIWGADAHEFRPERWLEDHPQKMNSNFGVYSTLGNFASGAVSCLGWRFAVIEMQTFMVEIVRQFQLSYPENGRRVIRATSGVMAPVLEGEGERGKQLRLVVSPL